MKPALQEKIRAGLDRLVQLPARRRRLGLVGDRRQPSVHDGVRGGGPGAGARPRACRWMPDRFRTASQWLEKDFAADPKLAADLRAYMQYALAVAGKPDASGAGAGLRPALQACRLTAWRCWAWRWNR